MKRKMLFIFILIIIAGGAVMAVFFCKRNKYKDLCSYTEKLLNVKWNDFIESSTGDVEREIGDEDWANIKLEVKAGNEEDILNILRNSFGRPSDISRVIMSGYQGHEFATEIEKGDLQYIFDVYMEGKWAKTRNVCIYVVYNEKGKMFIYVMG